jgi:hypothetical protein
VLKIFKDFYIRSNGIVLGAFLVFYAVMFFLLQGYGIENNVWFILAFLLICVYMTTFITFHSLYKRVKEDLDALTYYLKQIDAKEYTAPLKVKHYLEFLEVTLLLKNLIKRVYNREKKKNKK